MLRTCAKARNSWLHFLSQSVKIFRHKRRSKRSIEAVLSKRVHPYTFASANPSGIAIAVVPIRIFIDDLDE
jgi:hypothetical protein